MASVHEEFATEEELRRSFDRFVREHGWGVQRWHTRKIAWESSCSEGEADVAWGGFSKLNNWGHRRELLKLLQESPAAQVVAGFLPRRVRCFDDLVERTGLSRSYVRNWLGRLRQAEVVVQLDREKWRLANWFSVPAHDICAFELKLEHWQRAICQARNYRAFAHRSYVVMPSSTVHRALAEPRFFRASGLGLVSHAADGETRVLIRPRRRRPRWPAAHLRAVAWLLAG